MSSMSTPDAVTPTREKGASHTALRLLAGAASVLARIGGALSVLLIVVVLALTTAGVFARYVLGRPLEGVDEACGFMVVAMVTNKI